MTRAYQLWRDRRGRVSPLRVAALGLLLVPVGLALEAWLSHRLAARPFNDLVHRAGYWSLIFLMIALAITPLRRAGSFSGLLEVRRLIGVGAFAYAVAHILFYMVDERFDLIKIALEIVKRFYLMIGLVAWLGLLTLAATSTDAMVRRLGAARWRRLHQASYVIAILGLIHFFQQTKADFTLPATVTGLFVWLMSYRLAAARAPRGELSTPALLILTIVVAALVILGEAAGIALWYRVSPLMVLRTTFDFDLAIRPGWYVLAAGLVVVGIAWARVGWGWTAAARGDGGSALQPQPPGSSRAGRASGAAFVPRQRP